jgi:hypothetical protein
LLDQGYGGLLPLAGRLLTGLAVAFTYRELERREISRPAAGARGRA